MLLCRRCLAPLCSSHAHSFADIDATIRPSPCWRTVASLTQSWKDRAIIWHSYARLQEMDHSSIRGPYGVIAATRIAKALGVVTWRGVVSRNAAKLFGHQGIRSLVSRISVARLLLCHPTLQMQTDSSSFFRGAVCPRQANGPSGAVTDLRAFLECFA